MSYRPDQVLLTERQARGTTAVGEKRKLVLLLRARLGEVDLAVVYSSWVRCTMDVPRLQPYRLD